MQQLEMLEKTDKRRCYICKEVKSKEDFYVRAEAKHGRQASCKPCQRQVNRKNRQENAELYAQTDRKYYQKNKQRYKERDSRYSKNKTKAASAANYAIKKGKITRQPCEECGAEKADAHHDDYAKPLEVRWLCRSHHRQWHVDNGEALNAFTVRHWTPPKEAQK
jgi:hypothetical protein